MQRILERGGTVSGLKATCAEVSSGSHVQGLMIVAVGSNDFGPAEVDPLLKELDLPLIGGIFPEISTSANC